MKQAAAVSPDAIIIVVTNPLDAMCHVAMQASGFPRERVIGMAGVLDSARFRHFIAAELNISVRDVRAFVLGGHGDTMVPLPRYSTVGGVPITELLSAERIARSWTGPATAAPRSWRSSRPGARTTPRRRPSSRWSRRSSSTGAGSCPAPPTCRASTAIDGLFVGVPVVLGNGGMEKIIEISLTDEETAALAHSAASVRELVEKLPA